MSAKEILEKEDLHNTYWGKIIIRAAKTDELSDEAIEDANNWQTCACGKARVSGPPVDTKLRNLGYRFPLVLEDGDWEQAAELIVAIEKRAKEVLS